MFWLLLPAAPLLLITAQFSPILAPPPQWWTWSIGRSVLLILVPAAVGATGAALEASRLRVRRTESVLGVRSPVSIIAVALWPSLVCALVTMVIAVGVIVVAGGGGTEGAIPWGIVGAVAAILVFHTCLGFALGSIVRPVFGIPMALVASYSWLGFTGTVDWFELRHLSGLVIETCCEYEQQPIAASLLSATLFSVIGGIGLLLFSCAVLRITGRHGIVVGATGVTLVTGALAVGLAVATGLGPSSAGPRDPDALVCSAGEVTVCLFPEQIAADAARTDRSVASLPTRVSALISRARAAGVDLPTRVSAYPGREEDRNVVRLIYLEGMTDEQLAASLASDIPGDICPPHAGDEAAHRETSRAVAVAQLRAIMLGRDATLDDVDDLYGQAAETLEAVVSLPLDAQAAWVDGVIAALEDCALHPPVP
ncbi:hypothetical protein [Microbacterium sp. T2.11-28]|uniref:DUF7224 domain-containing protein n=1 Tax=Microbacterium sp. T2.11-28 TaxID=3041169 RepID=UPI002477632D|nr:hypothetical protein [Microbacterium sp. T2.11-28]CAI9389602.1 hypothetical protein MICABA_01159 [Microbacterium sp. T2.11-28]